MSAHAGGGGGSSTLIGVAIAVVAGIIFVNWLFSPTVIVHRYESGRQEVARQDGFRPLARRASVPSANQVFAQTQHRVTRHWGQCDAGYDQDPVSGTCSTTTWHPGPMPID